MRAVSRRSVATSSHVRGAGTSATRWAARSTAAAADSPTGIEAMDRRGRARGGKEHPRHLRHWRGVGVRALVGLIACAALPARLPAQDSAPQAREVVDLRFEGAQAFRAEQLRSAI